MQWNSDEHSGFSTAGPWLPISEDYVALNVETLKAHRQSILWLYKRLIELRASRPALSIGGFHMLAVDGDVLLYERRQDDEQLLVALNFSPEEKAIAIPLEHRPRSILLSTALDREGERQGTKLRLRPNEGVVLG
jgi:alpha-glucosidase